MINLFKAIWRAWQTGQIIRDPAKWKSGGELTTYVTAFVSAVFTVLLYIFPKMADYLTPEMAALFGTLILTILGMIQIIIGRITTKKEVGLNVLFKDDKDPSNPGRREDDIPLSLAEKRIWGVKDYGVPQGKDIS